MKSLTKLLVCLFSDLSRHHCEHKRSLDKDLSTLIRRYENEGLSFLTKTLPDFGDAIFASLESGSLSIPCSFRKQRGRPLPVFLQGLVGDVFDLTGHVRDDASESSLMSIRQVSYLFKKLVLTSQQEETLDVEACNKFLAVETDVLEDISDNPFIRDISTVSRYLWTPIQFDCLEAENPRNGPGGVAERLKPNAKYRAILSNLCDYEASTILGYTFIEMNGQTLGSVGVRDESRLVSVPKNASSRRTITIEPVCRMFMQQHLNNVIRRSIARSPFLQVSLPLNDQSVSQQRALLASRTREYATVDLSSASDLLSCLHVQKVFAHDELLKWLLFSTRTPYVRRGQDLTKLKKYAGMGNATTFPVQSIVFLTLSVTAILRSNRKPVTKRNVEAASRNVTVYGDDIILPSTAYAMLVEIMDSLGLRVNAKKTFVHSRFRESCGVDAYNGVDITPIYVRHDLDCASDPSVFVSLVSLSNQLFEKGYNTMAEYIKDICESFSRRKLPYIDDHSAFIGWKTRNNLRSYRRFNKRYQRFEDYGPVCITVDRSDKISGLPRLLANLLSNGKDMPQVTDKTPYRGKTSIRWRWAV